ncbi:MAG TPA: hypothetical protein PKE53_00610 [Flavobacteriales bacterium]|jgi:predicted small lipoprotein YifL|nr:hypothetical protein [Flavobacteriales bacterium]HMU12471.1 hypothetical protein [Flavobacteriales bacterium]HMZ47667.1 hypothetical protein [Flavobacteriales bacterium]HNA31710.1 hypothetical protein [Flavobacteriales bacterium]HNE81292.1 hypothetical protein [Flavobacteriales bacterium]
MKKITIITILAVALASCTKDEGPLYVPEPASAGDPVDTAYFNAEVLPIFTAHCWTCHPPMGDMDLSAAEAYNSLVGVESTNHAPALRVAPGDPEGSVLWNKINYTEVYGLGMPPDGTALSSEELATIRDWIEQGALNN